MKKLAKLKERMKPRLIDNWRRAHRMRSVQLSLGSAGFWGGMLMLQTLWPSFAGVLSVWWLAVGGMFMGGAIAIARITKQPGVE